MTLDKYKAVILGLACGDALGAVTEFMGLAAIRERWPNGIQHINQTNGMFTDDTQMTVALAEGLTDAYEVTSKPQMRQAIMGEPNFVMPYVANSYVKWAFSLKNDRAPGTTCMAGCRNLRDGKHWTESGIMDSKGCGSAMRAAPVGLVYSDPDQLEAIARASSVITHGHPAALDAAHAAAFIVRALLDGTQPINLPGLVTDVCTKDDRFYALISEIPTYVASALTTPELIDTHLSHSGLGESWKGDEAVASALYCFLLAYERGEGYVETVRYGANTKGDSDSIAAISGSFAGAYWGLGKKGVPHDWIEYVEDHDELELLASRLWGLAGNLSD